MISISSFRAYVIGSLIVWTGLFVATAITLGGDDFTSMLIVLVGPAFWFLVIVPSAIFNQKRER